MKHKLARLLLALTFLLMLALTFAAFAALGAEAPADPASVAAPPSWVLGLIEKYPALATILLIVGGLRLVVKPIFVGSPGTELEFAL